VPVLAALDDAMLHVRRDQKADRGHDERKSCADEPSRQAGSLSPVSTPTGAFSCHFDITPGASELARRRSEDLEALK
jgi:hypothetical protein